MDKIETYFIEQLLGKVALIDLKYQSSKLAAQFNVFTVLGKYHDEVNVHSKFLHAVLCPSGAHGKGNLFLKLLLEQVGIKDFDVADADVRREYRDIDLLISNSSQAVIIENKIWARDQSRQLERYYDIVLAEGITEIFVVYLTPFGGDASEQSKGRLVDLAGWTERIYRQVSYRETISSWLEKCLQHSYDRPGLREVLIQYRNTIDLVSGKTMNEEEKHEILSLLSQGDNAVKAQKIAENWNHLKWHTEWDFWNALEREMERDVRVLDLEKFSDNKISSVVHQVRNRNPWYGLMCELGSYRGHALFLFIERSDQEVYYGVVVEPRALTKSEEMKPLVDALSPICHWGRTDYWLGGNYPEPKINFGTFSTKPTLMLANSDFRSSYVVQLWAQMKSFRQQVLDTLGRLQEL
ncbi:PDDEXK-like family protein [Pedobacter chitinilyticus]|uniref:PD-(D/E)XK nuclease family protein n=1 Tax=Pedobacter chitinilyticus TaxID=2233776 RepID=A0A443Z296_9SPHI|nr:PD-(D/E)XK nuclease family protein [Pedobacter chitinilyticus]RWU10654.1 hypothetical protein DPV69_04760 [Pedobacter chitinilyticus]